MYTRVGGKKVSKCFIVHHLDHKYVAADIPNLVWKRNYQNMENILTSGLKFVISISNIEPMYNIDQLWIIISHLRASLTNYPKNAI